MESLHGCTAHLLVNYQFSLPIPIRSGVWQGDPLAPLLFNLTIQPLIDQLEAQGIKTQAHADDIALHLRTKQEAAKATISLKHYEASSGAKLNWEKSIQLPYQGEEDFSLPFKKNCCGERYLGVMLQSNGKTKFLPNTLENLYQNMVWWRRLWISLSGRMAIVSAYL